MKKVLIFGLIVVLVAIGTGYMLKKGDKGDSV